MCNNIVIINGLVATLRLRNENVNEDENYPTHMKPLIRSAAPLHKPFGRDIGGG